MAPKYKREDDDPDWAPLTPEQTKKTASNRLRATPVPKKSTNNGKQRVRVRRNTKPHELKTLQSSFKKRRLMRKRMSLNKLIELTRMVHVMRKFDCTTSTSLNLAWMNVKRARSKTAIPRQDYSSPFAAHTVGQDHVAHNHSLEFKNIIVYTRKGKHNDTNSAVEQSDAAAVSKCDDLSSSSFVAPDLSMSEQNVCAVVETEQVMVAEPVAGKSDESNPSRWVEEDLDSGNKANAVPARFKKHIASVPFTPSNCGKSQSLIDTLMTKKTTPKSEKTTPKRHRPKVVDDQIKSTSPPNPRTPKPTTKVKMPKPAREVKVKRKLDFNNEGCTMDQEELKPQDSSLELPKICKRKSMMTQKKFANLKTSIDEVSIIPDLNVSIQQEDLPSTEEDLPSTATVPEHSSECKTKNVLLILDESLNEALVDYATHKMTSLRIDDSVTELVVRDSNKFDPSKTHKAMIDFDPETLRVWDQLMGHNWSESTEADGSDNGGYMKDQRKLFRERVDLFLARMRVYQGDKQFSPWKGSVVDSIVGVFLTQNVSDYLSSNAYMSIASAYPPLSVSEQNSQLARDNKQFLLEPNIENGNESSSQIEATQVTQKGKGKGKQEIPINWDELRIRYSHGIPIKREDHNADSINWEAVRQSSAADLAKVIEYRGMSNQLAGRIKRFLDRLVRDHGSIDLEWLRNVPPSKAKDYLLSFNGLGLKSTECVRLLALHFPSFPVDTNAGRFFVRVGWVKLKPLPDGVYMHLLNYYPLLDSVQKYMWPRICNRDKLTLYEFHCHSVTIAKSFCTKVNPNCNHCPMRGECRHYASAFASSRLHLEGSQAKSASDSSSPMSSQEAPMLTNFDGDQSEEPYNSCSSEPIIEFPPSPGPRSDPSSEPITEFPTSPAPELDMEDFGCDSEIPTIKLNGVNGVEFSEKIRNYIGDYDEISKALVAISPSVGSIPMPKLKEAFRLRTVHQVYELPDSHHLLAKFENREPEDTCPYLLAIWPADETINSKSISQESREVAPFVKHDRIQGTILIPCRTANRGRFPLNGTYFQTNEVFADHASSRQPIDVAREFIWNLKKRTLYCGTSITSICRGMSDIEVAFCFQRCFICVRGFDTKTRRAAYIKERFHKCKSRKPETE